MYFGHSVREKEWRAWLHMYAPMDSVALGHFSAPGGFGQVFAATCGLAYHQFVSEEWCQASPAAKILTILRPRESPFLHVDAGPRRGRALSRPIEDCSPNRGTEQRR
jgi:hypothetical protein